MNKILLKLIALSVALVVFLVAPAAHAVIHGITGTTFDLTAKTGYITIPDGGSYLMWGYAEEPNGMQYPGPTLIVNQGEAITVNLTNDLTVPVSIVFPGQTGVVPIGGSPGLLTNEAAPSGGTVSYSFTPSHAGTYMYHSGTNPELQIEMGLVGALIVRPTGFDPNAPMAYGHPDTAYEREVLFMQTEMDPNVHILVEQGQMAQLDLTKWFPRYWFLNGRCAVDTLLSANNPLFPTQPYNCLPMIHPGKKLLVRDICAGRDVHPYHRHGNNWDIIARDGRLLQSAPGAGPDLKVSDFTITVAPGGTADGIFSWTGEKLGWDIYGHDPNDPLEPDEYAPDHGKPIPVQLPQLQDLTFGGFWSGSPFLGFLGALPPAEGGNNPSGAFTFMWHSHNEKELTNDDIFPGGMMTLVFVVPPSVPIVE